MIISEVTINNFRCYYGSNNIKFNSDGKITLIYGDSGYGKSSFLHRLPSL
jgi:DNA repair exonuclease SbcCD ATPase subunit